MISGFIEPWRLVAYLFSVALLTWAGTRGSTSSPPSATSSADHSEAGSPVVGDSPPNELVQQVTSSVSAAMNQQKALLDRLIELQSARLARDEDQEVESRAREIRTEARQEEVVAAHDLKNRKLLEEMHERVKAFEEVLKVDRTALPQVVEPPLPPPPSLEEVLLAPAENEHMTKFSVAATSGAAAGSMDQQVAQTVERLRRNAMPPQQVYIEALTHYRAEDREEWCEHFPPGYRERIAPTWLGEIYGTGRTGRDWAKNWLRERDLGDCAEARELLPTMCAIDNIFLHDKLKGAINSISTEKVARKAYGIVSAFENVRRRADWQKPGGAKSWTSRVDYETWARIDPGKLSDRPYVNRRVEDEIRGEMDRDAQLLKAKTKLAEQKAKERKEE